jgi:ribosomal protein S18 acetylase RimI-like enzyme
MMKKLLYILLVLSNVLLLGSERNLVYTKDTCNRTHWGESLSAEEQKYYPECAYSRWEVYNPRFKKYIANIAYEPSECHIALLGVDEEYRKKGIGRELANKAIEDMRTNHNCGDIDLTAPYPDAQAFWKKVGAEKRDFKYVFPDPASKLPSDSKEPSRDLAWFYYKYGAGI